MFCEFDLKEIRFTGDGLLGGQHEFDPYAEYHASFGEYKQKRELGFTATDKVRRKENHASADHTRFTFDPEIIHYKANEALTFKIGHDTHLRGDDSIYFATWCHTKNSGVDAIDAMDAKETEWQTFCGELRLPLYNIFQSYKEAGKSTFSISYALIDRQVVNLKIGQYAEEGLSVKNDEERAQLFEKAARETHKGFYIFEIEMKHFDESIYKASIFHLKNLNTAHLNSILTGDKLSVAHEYTESEYEHRRHQRHHRPKHSRLYWWWHDRPRLFSSNLSANGTTTSECRYLPIMTSSEKGIEKIVNCMKDHVLGPYCNHFLPLEENGGQCRHQPINALVSRLHMPSWDSPFGNAPVYAYFSSFFVNTREYAFEEERRQDFERYGLNEKSERYLLLLLNSSLRRHGLSAQTFQREMEHHYSPDNKSIEPTPLFGVCRAVVADIGTFLANNGEYMADYRFVTREKNKNLRIESEMIQMDDWRPTLITSQAKNDDCDGLECMAGPGIEVYRFGRHALNFTWESSLMQTIQKHLSYTAIYQVGATVTSAYVKDDKTGNRVELPMVDSRADKESTNAGHCHGIMETMTNCIRRLEASNVAPATIAKVRAANLSCPNFLKRDAVCQALVLEPTASIVPYILPDGETHANSRVHYEKQKAEHLFQLSFKTRLQAMKDKNKRKAVSEMFHAESLPHYTEKQDPQRRISSFYNEVVHGVTIDFVKRFGPEFAQLAFMTFDSQGKMCYGAKIADFIRHPDKHPIVLPFANHVKEWEEQVKPCLEAMQRQLPLASFASYTDEQYAKVYSIYHHVDDIQHGYDFLAASDPARTEASQAEFETLVGQVAEHPNHSIVRFQIRARHFQNKEAPVDELKSLMANAPGLVAHAYYSESHLPPKCDPVGEIICVIDVKKCLALEK